MRKVLVLGASGSMGVSLTKEWIKRGVPVIAFARNRERLEKLYAHEPFVTIDSGDGLVPGQIARAAQDAEIIFFSANVPYPEWKEKLPLLLQHTIEAAKENSSKLVLIDNIYAYGKNPGHKVAETHPKNPHTRKGKIRLQMAQQIHEAQRQGIPGLILHFPDFYGPHAGNTLLHTALKPLAEGKRGIFVGPLHVPREYIFMPDAAKAAAELSLREAAYGQHWNIPGCGVITGHEILEIASSVLNRKCRAQSIGRFLMSVAGLFQPFMREVVEMMYLTEDPVILDGSKYEREIGPIPATPYEAGIKETLEHLLNKAD